MLQLFGVLLLLLGLKFTRAQSGEKVRWEFHHFYRYFMFFLVCFFLLVGKRTKLSMKIIYSISFLSRTTFFPWCVVGVCVHWNWRGKVDWNIKISSGGLLVSRARCTERKKWENVGNEFGLATKCNAELSMEISMNRCLVVGFEVSFSCPVCWQRCKWCGSHCHRVCVYSCECMINVLLHICLNHQKMVHVSLDMVC